MMMMDYVNLLVEYVIIFVSILSRKDKYPFSIQSITNLLVVEVVVVIYTYIYR